MTETETLIIEALKADGIEYVSPNWGGFAVSPSYWLADIVIAGIKIPHPPTRLYAYSMFDIIKKYITQLSSSPNYPLYMAYCLGNRHEEI